MWLLLYKVGGDEFEKIHIAVSRVFIWLWTCPVASASVGLLPSTMLDLPLAVNPQPKRRGENRNDRSNYSILNRLKHQVNRLPQVKLSNKSENTHTHTIAYGSTQMMFTFHVLIMHC